jgi:hypothetical protein
MRRQQTLQLLDLGFNKLSGRSLTPVHEVLAVASDASDQAKLFDLTVNLMGNDCDQDFLDTPGMSRSKLTFRFAHYTATDTHVELTNVPHLLQRLRTVHKLKKRATGQVALNNVA